MFAPAFSRANPTPLSLSLSLNEVKRQQESDRGWLPAADAPPLPRKKSAPPVATPAEGSTPMNENMHENLNATADTAADQALTLPSGQPVLPDGETTCACCGAIVKIADCAVVANGDLVCGECIDREYRQCDCCGDWFPRDALTETGNGDLVCESCLDREYGQCDECGEWFPCDELTETGNGYNVCESCLDDGYFCCEDCGEWYPEDVAVEVNPGTRDPRCVCEDCADHNYHRCDDCGSYFDTEHISYSDAHHDICTNCSDDWCTCSCCGEVMHVSDAVYDDDSCEYYCADCAPASRLHSYGYKPSPVFGTTEADDGLSSYLGEALTFGVELECDGGDSVSDALADIYRITDRCYCKHDGSLSSNGYEIVTHPGTLAWHKERFPWADVCKASLDNGFRSHDTDTCGLHVHVGRAQLGDRPWDTAAKMSLITYRLKDWFVRFSRRGGETRWAEYVKPGTRLGDDEQAFLGAYYEQLRCDRYRAVNVRNDSTVEVRIFRGTLNPGTVLACLELVSNLALYAKENELEDCLAVTWDELVHYGEHEELTDYCSRRMAPLSDAKANDIPVVEPLPEPGPGEDLFPCGCDITLDDSDSSALQPGDIVCCVAPGSDDTNPVGCCGLVMDYATGAGAWLLVEWFTPGAHRWESADDLRHGRDGRCWGLLRRDVRRVAYVGQHYLSRRDGDLTHKVFTTYGLLPGDRVKVIDPSRSDAHRVANMTGTYLLSMCANVNDVPLCEASWLSYGRGHNCNGLLPSYSDGWRVVASNLRRVDN